MVISDQDEESVPHIDGNKMSDWFFVDIESLSNGIDNKDITSNSRITLQRGLSPKGSERGERITTTLASTVGVEDGSSTDVNKSNIVPLVPIGPTEPINTKPQSIIKIVTESRCRRHGKKPSVRMLDPRGVLWICATLSSMGTMILIYLALSTKTR